MQTATRSPNYLSRNSYSYCFRIKIPQDLKAIVTKKELRYSLKTGSLSEAKIKARFMAGQFQLLFKKIRHMDLTKEQVNNLIKEYKERLFEKYDRPVMYGQYDEGLSPERQMSREDELQWTSGYKEWLLDTMGSGSYKAEGITDWRGGYISVEQAADDALIEKGINPDDIQKQSEEYSSLCKGIIQTEIEGTNRYQDQLNGNFPDELEQDLTGITTPPQQPKLESVDHGPLLSEFIKEFPQTKPKWRKASHSAYQTATKVLLKIMGDIPVGTITRAMLVRYRETLAITPSYWMSRHKKVKVKDLPAPGLPTINNDTFDKNIVYLKQLMDYAVDREYLDYSPMPKTQMSLPDDKKEVHQFDDDQVKIILDVTAEFGDHRYWLPLLGLYTGCRSNEVCQLHKEDLKEKDGIWYLDINNDGKKTLKNKPSKRLVPLHPVIIELGFIDYVRNVNHHRIFPECTYRESTGKYANNFGQWFNRLLVSSGIKQKGDRTVTFHSFRHRVYTTLKRLRINNEHIDLIIGHKLSDSKNPEYHHGYLLPDLKADIEKIPDHRTI